MCVPSPEVVKFELSKRQQQTTNDKTNNAFDVGRRNYILNEEKAIEKKLSATESGTFEIIETGGGVKHELCTGMYEL